MKFTKKKLQTLIEEELNNVLEQIGMTTDDPGSETLELGSEFGPEGQLQGRLSMQDRDTEGLNKLANKISSLVRYMLANPEAGEGDQNIEYLSKAIKELDQYVEYRLMGLLDPDRPVQGGPRRGNKPDVKLNVDPSSVEGDIARALGSQ